jgi:adenine-specific DNA-methyltransferase
VNTPRRTPTVRLLGVDIYDPTTDIIRSDDTSEIALWMIDSDYDEEPFFVRRCYFSGGGTDPYARLKRALRAEIDEQAWDSLYDTRSRTFLATQVRQDRVKVINHYGDEVLKVFEVESRAPRDGPNAPGRAEPAKLTSESVGRRPGER